MSYFPICVDIDVALKPNVKLGEVKTHMCGKQTISPRKIYLDKENKKIKYKVYQMVCLEIPIEIDVSNESSE